MEQRERERVRLREIEICKKRSHGGKLATKRPKRIPPSYLAGPFARRRIREIVNNSPSFRVSFPDSTVVAACTKKSVSLILSPLPFSL